MVHLLVKEHEPERAKIPVEDMINEGLTLALTAGIFWSTASARKDDCSRWSRYSIR